MRLAIIASHPIQYHAPWYRALSKKLGLKVYYAHKATPREQARAGFEVPFEWDLPILEGYDGQFLENRARNPAVDHFFGCNTPGIEEIIRNGKFNAMLINGWNLLCYWQSLFAARKMGIPVLVRGDSQLPGQRGPLIRFLKEMFYPVFLDAFDGFLSVGKRNAEYLKHYGVGASKIFHVPHCVDHEFFAKKAEEAKKAVPPPTERFCFSSEEVVFLYAGKFIPKKRPLDFLKALDVLKKDGLRAKGLLVGDGPLRPSLEKHVHDFQTPCVFVGFLNQSEIGKAYAAADVLVLPSDGRETWGLVVNEVMACGLSAIVSDQVGCAPDLVLDGQTGFVYPCGNINELAERMKRMTENPDLRARLAQGALEHVRSYSIEEACRGLMSALETLCSR